jgi:hypothetical protein
MNNEMAPVNRRLIGRRLFFSGDVSLRVIQGRQFLANTSRTLKKERDLAQTHRPSSENIRKAPLLEPLHQNDKAISVPVERFRFFSVLRQEQEQITTQGIRMKSLHEPVKAIVALSHIDRRHEDPNLLLKALAD